MRRSVSTITREVKRNSGDRGYRPRQAALKAQVRAVIPRGGKRVSPQTVAACLALIRAGHSPEQASGRCKRLRLGDVSHEWLYREIYRRKANGDDLWKNLRCQKIRRKRYGVNRRKRGQIPHRVGIEQRCKRVENRSTVGHWELDLVKITKKRGFVVTMLERKTGYVVMRAVKTKNSTVVADAIIAALRPLRGLVRTMTFDNGLEFAQHSRVALACRAKTYFADPFCSNQRASNENLNGLLRQYVPKRKYLPFSFQRLDDAQTKLNSRARKRLDWMTPFEAMKPSANFQGVALAS